MVVTLPQLLAYAGLGAVILTAILSVLAFIGMILGRIPPYRDNG